MLHGRAPVLVTARARPVPEVPMIRPLALLFAVALALAACNTVHGLGRNMSAAGDTLSDTARDVQRGI